MTGAEQLTIEAATEEDPAFLREQLITYLGNKRALLPFIGQAVFSVKERLQKNSISCLDLFSGTGVVSRYLKQHASLLVANDLEAYSEITNQCYLTNADLVDFRELEHYYYTLERQIEENWVRGFIAELYSPECDEHIKAGERAFYTRRNAEYLDTARIEIGKLPAGLQKFFLAPLLSKASVHANTSGVFKGFYKSRDGVGKFGGHGQDALSRIKQDIRIALPIFSRFSCDSHVFREDANELVSKLDFGEFDLAYLDPPYNQHPYGSNYFMLNLLSDYERPCEISEVSGIPKDWNRSKYNQRRAVEDALFHVIRECPAKYVLISYNSEGFVDHQTLLRFLQASGRVSVFETAYNTFRGSRNLNARALHVTEYLYLLEKA